MTHHHAAAASRVQEIVKMANMIKAMSPSEREAHLEDLSRGTDVNVPKPLVDALIKMSDKDIGDLEEAAIELSGADENNIPADAVSTIHRKFKELPTVARKALIEELPQEVRPAVVALQFVPSAQAGAIARKLPKIRLAAEKVFSRPRKEKMSKRDAKRVDAAMEIQKSFTLPPRARQNRRAWRRLNFDPSPKRWQRCDRCSSE